MQIYFDLTMIDIVQYVPPASMLITATTPLQLLPTSSMTTKQLNDYRIAK